MLAQLRRQVLGRGWPEDKPDWDDVDGRLCRGRIGGTSEKRPFGDESGPDTGRSRSHLRLMDGVAAAHRMPAQNQEELKYPAGPRSPMPSDSLDVARFAIATVSVSWSILTASCAFVREGFLDLDPG